MNSNRKMLKNILNLAMSNIATVFAGVIVGFVIPKILSLNDYGFYKIFTLYTTYIGVFNLGIADGIVLKYGGVDYKDLPKEKFRGYFGWFILIHLFFFLMLTIVSLNVKDSNLRYIILALGVDMFAVNITAYFQQVSQITMRFNEYTRRKFIQSLITIVIAGIMLAMYVSNYYVNYKLYILFTILGNLLLTSWYIYTYRELVYGQRMKLVIYKKEVKDIINMGFPLLFANLCSTLILSADRQIVSLFFDTRTYAMYAFAYNMLSIITVAISAVSTVLYPSLKRSKIKDLKNNYGDMLGVVLSFLFLTIICYFPLCIIVNIFLPQFAMSLNIFRIVLPGIVISSSISIVMHNYYKVLGDSSHFFKKSIFILLLTVILDILVYFMFESMEAISIASILTMIIWYLLVEWRLISVYRLNPHHNFIYLVVMGIMFYVITFALDYMLGFIAYLLVYVCITAVFERKEIELYARKISKSE